MKILLVDDSEKLANQRQETAQAIRVLTYLLKRTTEEMELHFVSRLAKFTGRKSRQFENKVLASLFDGQVSPSACLKELVEQTISKSGNPTKLPPMSVYILTSLRWENRDVVESGDILQRLSKHLQSIGVEEGRVFFQFILFESKSPSTKDVTPVWDIINPVGSSP